ncbi:terpenoid synthase [Penicillium frequentans]|nr:terpenoid synthase [Penicillium glabrum]
MDFKLTEAEVEQTSAVTSAAYDAWVLVNDYFSWEKELQNNQANGGVGEIVNAVFLFMKWYDVDWKQAKSMLRSEIVNREKKYCQERADLLARGKTIGKIQDWFLFLDLVTAGNFAWSMTTARYDLSAIDAYPALRIARQNVECSNPADSLSLPISRTGMENTKKNLDGGSIAPTNNGHANDKVSGGISTDVPKLDQYESQQMVLAPFSYINSLPSKGVRNSAIDGLDAWYHVPPKSLETIQEITNLLHASSLMIDDIEDNSELRRSCPATHTIFGVAQTTNSANLVMFKALKSVGTLSPKAVSIFTEKLIEGHIGQGMDLYWKQHTQVPTEEEYFAMVDGSELFVLVAELMRSEATRNKDLDLSVLMKVLSRFFQARDDCMNLKDSEYTKQKGFAEDINEGKISLPLIHAMSEVTPYCDRLRNILQLRKTGNGLAPEIRELALGGITSAGGLEYAKGVVLALQRVIDVELKHAEEDTGINYWVLRLLQKRLEI